MNKINILYEDNHLIVVEKPFNILSQKDDTNDPDMLTLIKDYIKEKYKKKGNVYLGLVHRLDRPTGGIMVFAKTSKAASRLSKQIQDNKFNKRYYAVITKHIKNKDTFIDYIKKDENNNSVISKDGKYAELSYKVIDEKNNLQLVDISLKTGRHHQIRIQFASRGYPLYGDNRYGKEDKNQLALFAHYLSFYHPTKNELMEFNLIPKYGIFKEFFGGKNER